MRRLLIVVASVLLAACVRVAPAPVIPDLFDACGPKAEVLLLGMFHFHNAGLDTYKEQFPFDPLTPEHQRQIEDVVDRLARYRPTKIGVESRNQARIDSLYRAYRARQHPSGPDEVEQIGFRLAAKLGQDRLYAIDAAEREYEPMTSESQWNARVAQYPPADTSWQPKFNAFYRFEDSLKTILPLRETLTRMSEPAYLRILHGNYLVDSFGIGRDTDYFGPDAATRWWNRNLRIFNNIQRITGGPDDRILVIIGDGHVPLLRHAVENSPAYRLEDVSQYLGDPTSARQTGCH